MNYFKFLRISNRLTPGYFAQPLYPSRYYARYGGWTLPTSSKLSCFSFSLPHFHKICSNPVPSILESRRWKQISSDDKATNKTNELLEEESSEKLSIFQRYRKMLKEYWYVLIPVHMVTSAFWFGGFYYAASCGLDIIPFLEYINIPEKFINPLRNSALGYIAVASAMYKIATPARYMVTLGGTTFAIRVLTKRGLIKPAPTKAQIKTIIQNKLKKEPSEHNK